jgi:hypothetical protein
MAWGLWWGSGPWGACIGGGPDSTPPTISLQNPAPGAAFVPSSAPFSFRLSDDLSGVDLGSVVITVKQGSMPAKRAFQNGWFLPPFKGPKAFVGANLTNGFDFILDPVFAWISGAPITITVTATDAQCNAATFTWEFQIAPCYGCVV